MNKIRSILVWLMTMTTLQVMAQNGCLIADGRTDYTYRLIRQSGYNHECPDSSCQHACSHFQHIRQIYDDQLQKPVFVFYIHAKIDDDRGKANIRDRQRNEIKTDGKSPATMVAQEGETLKMSWKFKLPIGFLTTRKFTHIHQLKGIDNKQHTADVRTPLITLTCYTKDNGQQVLRLRYGNRSLKHTETLITVPLAPFIGEWIEAEETVTFASQGKYFITLKRIRDGKILLHFSNESIDMWQTGSTGLRPKWGIYRYIGDNRSWESMLRDEEIRFADFCIQKTND